MNKFIGKGRLTRDPEIQTITGGSSVCKFTVAVDNMPGSKKKAEFVPCNAWNKLATVAMNFLFKGKEILFVGSWHEHEWTSQTGEKRSRWEVLVDAFEFCGTKADNVRKLPTQDGAAPKASDEEAPPFDMDDKPSGGFVTVEPEFDPFA